VCAYGAWPLVPSLLKIPKISQFYDIYALTKRTHCIILTLNLGHDRGTGGPNIWTSVHGLSQLFCLLSKRRYTSDEHVIYLFILVVDIVTTHASYNGSLVTREC